jgi:hypothetical protein
VTFFIFIKICSDSLAFVPTCLSIFCLLILHVFALSWICHDLLCNMSWSSIQYVMISYTICHDLLI